MFINNMWINILNKMLSVNESFCIQLKEHYNKTFVLEFAKILTIKASIDIDGKFKPYNLNEFTTTIHIPASILNYKFLQNDSSLLIKYIKINGDKLFAINLLKIFASLDIMNSIFLNIWKNPITNTVIKQVHDITKNQIKTSYNYFMYSIAEFLQYSRDDIVTKHELETFYCEVDLLKERTALIQKKLDYMSHNQ